MQHSSVQQCIDRMLNWRAHPGRRWSGIGFRISTLLANKRGAAALPRPAFKVRFEWQSSFFNLELLTTNVLLTHATSITLQAVTEDRDSLVDNYGVALRAPGPCRVFLLLRCGTLPFAPRRWDSRVSPDDLRRDAGMALTMVISPEAYWICSYIVQSRQVRPSSSLVLYRVSTQVRIHRSHSQVARASCCARLSAACLSTLQCTESHQDCQGA
jgi:hypothetical protein